MASGAYLLLHGLDGSGPGHWQRWIAGRLAERGAAVRFPDLPAPAAPQPDAWLAALGEELGALGTARADATVLCHSLGCLLWLRWAATPAAAAAGPVARALLVAPPLPGDDVPALRPWLPPDLDPAPLARAARETRLVCADDDPWCPAGADRVYGGPLGVPVEVVPGGGHLNPDAGFGPWPRLEAWCLGATASVTPAR